MTIFIVVIVFTLPRALDHAIIALPTSSETSRP